jgi:hypothetical protein
MGYFVELPADGGVNMRMPMAVNVAPEAADAVEVFTAVASY